MGKVMKIFGIILMAAGILVTAYGMYEVVTGASFVVPFQYTDDANNLIIK